MCTPYPNNVNDIEKKFLEDNGFKVLKCEGMDLVDNNILAHLPPSVLYRMGKAVDTPDSDGVFISCTGIDALDVIEALEQDLGKPVFTSNQVAYWMLFKMAGVGEPIQGYGRLMREPRYRTAEERERRLQAV
jgi:maleate cis-trans isomerase